MCTDSETGGEILIRETKSLMRERQKVPLSLSCDLAPVRSISVTPDHRLDMELFYSHDWASDIYP